MKTNRAALHVDNGLMPIFSSRCCRQSQNVFCFDFTKDSFKRHCRQMMTFIHNHVSVVRDEIFDCPFTLQALNYSNINQTGSLSFPSPVLSDVPNRQS
jgi:hypothetical protein